MASLRNAIPQRPYRERAQPGSRAKLGMLEKHKDYSARAKDYNAKKARLKILRQKATDRNPDEFHFGMMSSKTKDGIKLGNRGTQALSQVVVKLMKTQDAGYLRTVKERVRRERLRLEESMQVMDEEDGAELKVLGSGKGEIRSGNHIVFVNDEDEQQKFEPAQFFGTDELGLGKTYNRTRISSGLPKGAEEVLEASEPQKRKRSSGKVSEEELAKAEQIRLKKAKHNQEVRKAKLVALKTQEEQLQIAEDELDRQRAKMDNTIGGINKNGVKFKVRERKR